MKDLSKLKLVTKTGMIAGLEKTWSQVAMYLDSGTDDLLADLTGVVLDETHSASRKPHLRAGWAEEPSSFSCRSSFLRATSAFLRVSVVRSCSYRSLPDPDPYSLCRELRAELAVSNRGSVANRIRSPKTPSHFNRHLLRHVR